MQIWLKFREYMGKVLQRYSLSLWWNLDTSNYRSEIPEKFWNVMLEKDGEDLLDRYSVRNEEVLHRVK
jgi:hypothetical protein